MRYKYAEENGKLVKTAVVYTQEEHGIDVSDVDAEATGIVKKLREAGFETYIVGGAVRDLLLKKKPKDFDIVSDANPAKIKKIFRNSRIIGKRFKLVHVYFGPRIYEVSTFRSLKDGLTSNTFGSIREDVLRRDFTINALFYDPLQEVVVDYVGGMKDIKGKRVKPIIPLATIFKDDPVRMIRAVKYGITTGFTLPMPLKWKIRSQSALLASVSPSRLTEEMFKILHASQVARIVDALDNLGLYRYLQPNAAKLMKDRSQFRARYLRSMAFLNGESFKGLPGETIGALINDYLEDITDWEHGVAENYKTSYASARSFVLPMNPPRFELGYAVRRFFAAHGITIKKSQVLNITGHKPNGASPSPEPTETIATEGVARKKRKRKRKPQEKKEAEN